MVIQYSINFVKVIIYIYYNIISMLKFIFNISYTIVNEYINSYIYWHYVNMYNYINIHYYIYANTYLISE